MRTTITWILLILLAVGGIVGSYALSEKFRTDAREVWEAKAAQSARWLSGTVLGWLEESYAPLSGLAVLFENSKEVTEVEFLGATDALEARATSFFLDAKAIARPRADGVEWSIEFSNDPMGPLSPDTPLGRHPVILETIKVAVDNPDQIMLGSPFSSEEGLRYSPAALAIQDVRGPLVVIGLVNYDAIVKGLFDIHKLDGLQLQIQGRFKEPGGPGDRREVIGESVPDALYSVTTRTVSAGADLSLTWYVTREFSKGPQVALANFTLMGGIAGILLVTLFIGMLLQRSRVITNRVQTRLDTQQALLDSVINHIPDLIFVKDLLGVYLACNTSFAEFIGRKREKIIGVDDHQLFDMETAEEFRKNDRIMISEGKPRRNEEWVTYPDGSRVLLDTLKTPFIDSEGRINGLVGISRDITERKKAEEDLKKLSTAVEQSPASVVITDPQGTIEYVNSKFCEVTGYSVKEAIGRNPHILKSGETPPEVYQELWKTITAGEEWRGELRNRKKNDALYWESVSISPITAADGSIQFYLAVKQDITEAKQMEESIREKEARFRGYFEHSQVGMAVTSPTKGWVEANDQLQKMLGYTLDELRHKTWAEFTHPDDIDADVQQFERMLAGEIDNYTLDKRFIRKDGEIVYTNLTVACIRDETGDVLHVLASFQDITERKKMDDDLNERIKELDEAQSAMLNMMEDLDEEKGKAEEATRAKSDFLANMSHEIRTPMNAVIGMAHLALKTELTPKQQDYLNKIQSSANSLLGIINDILDFSKIEAGKLDMEAVEFDLLETMDNVANVITVKAQEKENLEVLFYLDPQVPHFLVGDSLRLNQILVNLGNNAVKFTEQGEIVLTTKIAETSDDKVTLQFSVRDTGIGMTEQQQAKLFQAFSQADTSTTRKYGGTGLGLTISKRLVNMMGGEIWTESEAGQGTTFNFTADFGLGKETVKRHFVPAPDLRGLKVLVVDDNATSREILQDILESFSFEVFLAASGKEALEEIERADKDQPFELVIMDWKMPGMDGLEASRRIKNHRKLSKIPAIVLVTAYGREEVMRQADDIGLDGFLLKPVNSSVMFDAIMQALGKEVHDVSRPGRKEEQSAEELHAISGARVLLVEDNEINQQVAQEILQGVGLKVTVANNGREGVDAAMKNQYDAILMDIQMPVMDGYTATRKIREWERRLKAQGSRLKEDDRGQRTDGRRQRSEDRGQRTEGGGQRAENRSQKAEYSHQTLSPEPCAVSLPIIAMTAHAMAGDEQKSLEAGMNGHVTKPIDPEQLFAALQKWIRPAAERAAVPNNLPASGGPPVLDTPSGPDQVVPIEDELPDSLPGFDLTAGLSRLMGNKRLYRKLLVDFGTKYTETAREIRGALDASDFDQAHSLVHNIKGLAGNLAATDLQTSAVNLEKLVKGVQEIPPSAKELTSKFSDLENALNRALESVQTMHSPAAAGEENAQLSPQAIVAKTPEISKDDVDRILTAAETGDIEALTAIAEALKTRSDAYTPFSDKLVELAEDFEFEAIGEWVSELEPSANT